MIQCAGASSDIDRSFCEVLLQILTDSLAITTNTPHDALRCESKKEKHFFLLKLKNSVEANKHFSFVPIRNKSSHTTHRVSVIR